MAVPMDIKLHLRYNAAANVWLATVEVKMAAGGTHCLTDQGNSPKEAVTAAMGRLFEDTILDAVL